MKCIFVIDIFEPLVKRCSVCNYVVVTQNPPEVVHRECRPKTQNQDNILAAVERLKNQLESGQVRPTIIEKATNLVKEVGRFVASGGETVSNEEYNRRLEICSKCEYSENNNTKCGKCGCFLGIKARGAVWNCPLKKW